MRRKIYNFIIKSALYGLVFFMPLLFLTWTSEAFEFNKQYLLVFLVALAFVAWLAKMILVRKKFVWRRTPLDIFILAFMLFTVLAAVFSIDKTISWLGFYGRFSDAAVGVLALGIMYFALVNNMSFRENESAILKKTEAAGASLLASHLEQSSETKKIDGLSLKKIFNLIIFSSFLAVLTAYFSIFGIWAKISWLPDFMKSKIFNPVSGSMEGLSVFLAAMISLIVGVLLARGAKRGDDVEKNRTGLLRPKGLAMTLLLIASVVLLMIIDFGAAWISLGIAMLVLLFIAFWTRLFKDRVNLLLLPIILLLISGFCWLTNFEKNFTSDILGSEALPQEIVLDYHTANPIIWQTFKSRPFFGSGPGTFLADFAKFKPVDFNQSRFWNIRFDKAPSQLLEQMATSGALGLLSYLAIIGIFLLIMFISLNRFRKGKAVQRSIRAEKTEWAEPVGLPLGPAIKKDNVLLTVPLLLAWFALLAGQIFYLGNTTLFFYFWLFTALIVSSWQKMGALPNKKIVFSFKKLPEVGLVMNIVLLLMVFAAASLFYLGFRFYLAEVKFAKAANENNEQMIKDLEKVVNLNSYREGYRRALSQAYLGAAWTEAKKSEQEMRIQFLKAFAEGAITQSRLASQLSPNLVMTWENLGMVYRDSSGLVSGSLPFALEAFNKALELEPNNPLYYRELCRINLVSEGKDLDETLRYCQRAVELKPNYLDARIQIALIYERKGILEEAVKQMETALDSLKGTSFQRGSTLASAATEIYFQLGRLYFNLNRVSDATKMFEQAAVITPEYANARFGLALSYQAVGRLQEALEQMAVVNQLVPNNEEVIARIKQIAAQLTPAAE